MSRAALALLFAVAALTAGENLPPHQATITAGERQFADVWVFEETLEGLKHTLDSNKESPPTTLARNRYQRVDYVRPNDVPWLRGDNAANKAEWATAATQFLEAATKSRESWWTRENSFLRSAEAFVLANKPDDAMKALDGLLAAFPKTVHQARVAYLRAQALHKKGDAAAALKAYGELAKKADWGIDAVALGSLGQAELLTADQKHAEAATVLAAAFAKLDAGRDAALFTQVGVALAQAQQGAKQNDPAIVTLRRLAYGAADASGRARAQIAWAELLATSTDAKALFEAFDHAVMAATAKGADSALTARGDALARQYSQRIDKLPADVCSNDVKAEYRRYLTR